MAFLTLFRVATGDNWNGIMKVNFLMFAFLITRLDFSPTPHRTHYETNATRPVIVSKIAAYLQ